jgi:hypothetical protein
MIGVLLDSRVAQPFVPAIVNYRSPSSFISVFALGLIIATPVSFAGNKKKKAAAPSPTPPPLIETTGSILGITLFEPLEEAREKLAKLKLVDGSATAESAEKEEEEQGERAVWRLAETDYQWIVAWADKEGKVVKISASVRPEKKKPFSEIGDLGRAKMHNESTALWIVTRPDGKSYRLVAKGPGEQAVTIYLYSLKAAPMN